jgi:hypothetical protein
MSSAAVSQPRRGRRYGWWIAGGVCAAAVLGLGWVAVVYLAEPAKIAYGFLSGNPALPNCDVKIVRETTAEPLWYRLVDTSCGGETMHFVYVRRGTGPGWFVLPAFMSAQTPVPVSVRPTGDDAFEIDLAQPLADGTASVPVEFDRNGMVKDMQLFDHGRKTEKSLSLPR